MNDDAQNLEHDATQSPIWTGTLDQRYELTVNSTPHPRYGRLTITDNRDGTILLDEQVPLSYGAVFGPDIGDVETWQERAVVLIDSLPQK